MLIWSQFLNTCLWVLFFQLGCMICAKLARQLKKPNSQMLDHEKRNLHYHPIRALEYTYVELAQSSIMEDIGGADPPDGNQENQYPWVSEHTVPGAYDVLNNPPLNLPVASGNCVRNQDPFLYNCLLNIWSNITIYLSTATVRS